MRESGLLKKYSLDMAMIELEKLHIIDKEGGQHRRIKENKEAKSDFGGI
ncbi:MAG: hypothetical protein QXZ12_09015 [Thermoplasmata archaeon]